MVTRAAARSWNCVTWGTTTVDDEGLSHAELLAQAQQVAGESEKHCRVTVARVLQKWSAVKAIAARLQKKMWRL